MKIKIFILAIFAIATLIIFSFTDTPRKSGDKDSANVTQEDFNSPAGGFGLERI